MKKMLIFTSLLLTVCIVGCNNSISPSSNDVMTSTTTDTAVSGCVTGQEQTIPENTSKQKSTSLSNLKKTDVRAVMWPEIVYATNDVVIIRHQYLIKFSLKEKRILDYMDMEPYGLDKLQGSSYNYITKVSPNGEKLYFEERQESTGKTNYEVNINKKQVKTISAEYMQSQPGIVVEDYDVNKLKNHHKTGGACKLPNGKILGFCQNGNKDINTYSWWAFSIYDKNGNPLETIPLFS